MQSNDRRRAHQQARVRTQGAGLDSYGFFNLLTGPQFLDHVESSLPEHRERLFPPTETLSMFLAQVMSADRSCQAAVNRSALARAVGGLPQCSVRNGGYCRARQRLPQDMISGLTRYTGRQVSADTLQPWRWQDRSVKLVDGTTVTLPDTVENQARFPQSGTQKAGLGFPICRIVGLICLASGAVLDMATGACRGKGGDEQSLLRSLLDNLDEHDVLLGDAYYATYFLLCELKRRGIDGVFEQHGQRRRSTDFRTGTRLGTKDHLIDLPKPKIKPQWMSEAAYEQAPTQLRVRELAVNGRLLITTLHCPRQTPKDALKALYAQRWNIELDFRNIKTTLGMARLSCRTPEMAIKEIWVFLLAYNLIRILMAQAASLADLLPRQLSFKHTLQLWVVWRQTTGEHYGERELQILFTLIAHQRVGKRPGRVEPRAIKRRSNAYPLLNNQRSQAQEDIRQHGHPKKLK